MKNNNFIIINIILAVLLCTTSSYAQLSLGGTPKTFQFNLKTNSAPAIITDSVDVQTLLLEDAEEEKQGIPQRFGYPFDVDYSLLNSGNWQTLPDGSRLWTLQIESPGAKSINLIYKNFWLAEGVRFYIYSADRTMLIGAFSSQNNKEHKKFATAPVQGDKIILELNVPANVGYPGEIEISRIVHAYRDFFNKDTKDFGSSGSCNNNVNCPEGDPWKDETNSVAMILLGNGFRYCSGAMVNNVREDLTPYFLTADHCLNSPETFIFMFNYQSPDCSNTNGPTTMTVQGSTLLANDDFSDFALLLLDETPPDSFGIFFSGWSAENIAAPATVGIHHPAGDIKKISFNNNAVTSTSYYSTSSGNNSHWRVDDWEDGTTEGGSSGSPLYDNNHRVIGQLHGGNASCASITDDWYGKFSVSWDGTASTNRLRDWLDPDSTGLLVLDGLDGTGLTFSADTTFGFVPLTVNFNATSKNPVDTWSWDFGDSGSSSAQNPSHIYTAAGAYDVQLDVVSGSENNFRLKKNYIIALADTLSGTDVATSAGSDVAITLSAENNIELNKFLIPIEYGGDLFLTFDSMNTNGCRTDYFEVVDFLQYDSFNKRLVIRLQNSFSDSQPPLSAGSGDIVNIYFSVSPSATPAESTLIILDGYNTYLPTFSGDLLEYQPALIQKTIFTPESCCSGIRGNVDNDAGDAIDIADLVYLVGYSFGGGPEPVCLDEADVDNSGTIDIADIVYLVSYSFSGGPAPAGC